MHRMSIGTQALDVAARHSDRFAVTALVAHYGWAGLGQRIPVRCFTHDPSMSSSLKFLRKTPWAREKVEGLYLFMLREQRRGGGTRPRP